MKTTLQQKLEREPSPREIAEDTGFTEKKVQEYLSLVPDVCSLDVATGEDADSTLQLLLEDTQTPQPQEILVRRELEQTMDALLGQLTQRQRQVLRLRFGMVDGNCYTQTEIGKMLGISKQAVGEQERSAMKNLHKMGTGLGLEDFLQ